MITSEQPSNDVITFFERFQNDIISGAKTITLRDGSESNVTVGQRLSALTFEEERWFCDIQVLAVEQISFNMLSEQHAKEENMTLDQLRATIKTIYPEAETLYMIRFRVVMQ